MKRFQHAHGILGNRVELVEIFILFCFYFVFWGVVRPRGRSREGGPRVEEGERVVSALESAAAGVVVWKCCCLLTVWCSASAVEGDRLSLREVLWAGW